MTQQTTKAFHLRRLDSSDRDWVRVLTRQEWGDEFVVVHGDSYFPHELEGIIAVDSLGHYAGLLTFNISPSECEIVTLNSLVQGEGIGTALVEGIKSEAVNRGCNRLWLITTNDNLSAIRFYRKRGFELVKTYPGAVDRARAMIKPRIPRVSQDGIPIHDELEMQILLTVQPGEGGDR